MNVTFRLLSCVLSICVLTLAVWACITGYYSYACPHSEFTSLWDRFIGGSSWGLLGVLVLLIEFWPIALVCALVVAYLTWCHGPGTPPKRWARFLTFSAAIPVLLLLMSWGYALATQAHTSCSIGF
jgi:hypothetical protein